MPVSDVDLMLSLLSGRRTVNPSADRHRHTSQRPARYECETRDEDQNGSCGKVRASRKQRMATGKVFGPFLVVPHSTPTYGEARLLVGLSGLEVAAPATRDDSRCPHHIPSAVEKVTTGAKYGRGGHL